MFFVLSSRNLTVLLKMKHLFHHLRTIVDILFCPTYTSRHRPIGLRKEYQFYQVKNFLAPPNVSDCLGLISIIRE